MGFIFAEFCKSVKSVKICCLKNFTLYGMLVQPPIFLIIPTTEPPTKEKGVTRQAVALQQSTNGKGGRR